MNACPQCGTVPKPSDKFCNTCGTPVAQQAPAPAYAPQAQYGSGAYAPAPPAPAYGAPPPRCQMGHDIAPGQSYCAQGHPIALDAMQFQGDAAYGQQQQQPYAQQPYAPPPQQQGYAPPQQAYGQGAPYAPPQPAFPQPQAGANYAPPGGYAPPPVQPAYDAPAAQPAAAPVAGTQPAALPANALRGFLITYQSNTKGEFWPLYGGRVTIGRASSGDQTDIPLADATISSRHAMFVVDGVSGTITVEDTGSTNGTYVNEEHLGFNGRRELRDGDRVRFGGFTTVVKIVTRI